ncbi:MAG: ABC transporter permease [Bacteriovoracaceae bacterium]|nr:ABC transporter permease [Bacteriovoracaceae bacterium]
MNPIRVVSIKEISQIWRSPLAWTLLGLFSLLSGWTFFNLLVGYTDNIQSIPADMQSQISFLEEVVLRLYGNINFFLLFFIPPLTMRLMAEEKKQGTLDLLLAAPIKDHHIIVGKFLATWSFTIVLLIPTLLFPFVLFWAGVPDQKVLLGCYLGLIANTACYVAVGLFASSLTENQVIAALLGFFFIMSTWLLSWIAQSTDNFMIGEILRWLSVTGHFETLVRGVLSTADLTYYLSFVGLSLYASVQVLGSRNW